MILNDELKHEIRQRQQFITRSVSSRANNDLDAQDIRSSLNMSLSKNSSRKSNLDPVLLDHEMKKQEKESMRHRSTSPGRVKYIVFELFNYVMLVSKAHGCSQYNGC